MALGNGTAITIWGRRIEVGAPKSVVASYQELGGLSTVCKEAKVRFP
jgi:hypothetical protein